MDLQIAATLVGVITGPAGLIIALLVYFRDRPAVLVRLGWDIKKIGGHIKDEKTYTKITIINKGRRPIYLSHASIDLPKDKKRKYGALLFSDGIDGVRLEEGSQPHIVTADQNHEHIKPHLNEWWKLRAIVIDASGKQYYSDWPLFGPSEYKSFEPSFLKKKQIRLLNFIRKFKP